MRIKVVIAAALMGLSSTEASAQKKMKTYNGALTVRLNENGKAVYNYYEEPTTGEYVKHGKFSFTLTNKNAIGGTYSYHVTGTFSSGNRVGQWVHKIVMKDYYYNEGVWASNYATGEITLIANYSDDARDAGFPMGKWSYRSNLKSRDIASNILGKLVYGQYTVMTDKKMDLQFYQGDMTGLFSFTSGNMEAKGGFALGELDGDILFKKNGKIESIKAENGRLITSVVRNAQGQVTQRIDYPSQGKLLKSNVFTVFPTFHPTNTIYNPADFCTKEIGGDNAYDAEMIRGGAYYYYQ